jgi:hypothetical protein
MGWKNINGVSYYYQQIRKGNDIHSVYVGHGLAAHRMAFQAELDSQERRTRSGPEKSERLQAEREDREVADWFSRVETIAQAAMMAAGYHKHHRSEWRRYRSEN